MCDQNIHPKSCYIHTTSLDAATDALRRVIGRADGQRVWLRGFSARVEPTGAPRTPGGRPELGPRRTQGFADFVVEFRRERALADSRRIGLGDAEHAIDLGRADARAGRLDQRT